MYPFIVCEHVLPILRNYKLKIQIHMVVAGSGF